MTLSLEDLSPLRAKYPFKHWKVGQVEFLGKMLAQEENWDIAFAKKRMP